MPKPTAGILAPVLRVKCEGSMMMVPECCEVKMMGREAVLYSDKSRLYTNASFPTGPTSTGHSVLIHRGGCRHVAGAKSIRVHTDIRTGKADGKGGRSGTICRSVYENSRFFSRRLRKASGGGRQAVVTHSTLDIGMIGTSLSKTPRTYYLRMSSRLKTTVPPRMLWLANTSPVY